jgi:4-hydroxybenzoate polyprenyltransferase
MQPNKPSSTAPRYVVQQTPDGPKVVEVSAAVDRGKASPSQQRAAPSTLRAWLALTRLDRPIGIYLLLWPTISALLLANQGAPPPHLIVIFALGVVLTRSAGCIINDYADQWLDGSVQRTQQRPLASGLIAPRAALIAFALLMLIAFALVCLTNSKTIALACVAALIACVYPTCKRYTHYPQAVLGLAFSMGIPMAYTASDQVLTAACWLLFCANWLWTMAYDTLYAMVDRDDDIKMGARSTAILFGELDLIALSILFALTLAALWALAQQAALSQYFSLGLLAIAAQFALQIYMARHRAPEACLRAFLANQWVGLTLFASVLAGLLLRS